MDGGPAGEYHQGEAHGHGYHKAQLQGFHEHGGSERNEDTDKKKALLYVVAYDIYSIPRTYHIVELNLKRHNIKTLQCNTVKLFVHM